MMGPKKVNKPDAESVNEAINLLVVMGGDAKAAKGILGKIKEAQEHNQRLLDKTNDAINQVAHAREALAGAESKFVKDSKRAREDFEARDDALNRLEAELITQETLFESAMREKRQEFDDRQAAFAADKREVEFQSASNIKFSKELDTRLTAIKRSEEANKNASDALAASKADMEKRDALVKAAMGG